MRGLHKVSIPFIGIIFLLLFALPLSYASITVVPEGECDADNVLFETYRAENSHTAVAGGNYDYVFCYEEKFPTDAAVETLTYNDPDTLRNCWGENTVLKATGDTNAHVAAPHIFNANEDQYTTDLCYGYLQCSPLDGNDQQVVAKLSSRTNAHISDSSTSNANFPTSLYCWEPICNGETFAQGIAFPNLYTFDSDKAQFETANLFDLGVTGAVSQKPPSALSFEALHVTLGGSERELELTPIRIQNWSGYAQLEFFVYYTDEANLRDMTFKLISPENVEYQFSLWEYATQTLQPQTWTKVRIPLNGIDSVDTIHFSLASSRENVDFYIDSMSFVPKVDATGQFETFYCSQLSEGSLSYAWIDDADSSNSVCDNIDGFSPTSNGCCGDDANEYFNGTNGGCFDSLFIPEETVFDTVYDSDSSQLCYGENCKDYVVEGDVTYVAGQNYGYSNGTFYSCGIENTAQQLTDVQGVSNGINAIETIKYSLPGATLKEGDACVVVGDYFCSPDGKNFSNRIDNVDGTDYFENEGDDVPVEGNDVPVTSASVRTVLKENFGEEGGFTCCPENYCNYEGRCYEDMSNEPWEEGIDIGNDKNNRCIGGKWSEGTLKSNFDGSEFGYCPQTSDCFVSNRGITNDPGSPLCIGNNENYYDNYCFDGSWSSRTAALAQSMVRFAVENEKVADYSLFCDSFDKALNHLGVADGRQVEFLLRGSQQQEIANTGVCGVEGCVNNFCVLNPVSGDTVQFGTSLNINITNSTYGLGAVFDLDCSGTKDEDGLVKCEKNTGDAGRWYFYPDSNIIIFKQSETFFGSIGDAIGDFFTSLASIFPWVDGPDEKLPDVFDEVKLYNRAYVFNGEEVSVQGFTEEVYDSDVEVQDYVDALYIKYESEQALEVCDVVDSIKGSLSLDDTDIECTHTIEGSNNIYTVVSTSSQIENIWVELTAKLRAS